MSPLAIGQPASWDGVTTVLEKIHAGGESFEQFLHRQLDELESLRVGMEQRERWLEEERHKLRQAERQFQAQSQSVEDQRQALERDLEQMRTETEHLARSKVELEQAVAELTRLREQSVVESGVADEVLLAQLAAAERQRGLLEQELAAARAQIARLADATAELAEVRAELLRLPERLAAEAETAKQELRVRIADLEADRAALDQELAKVRTAASELADAAAERDAIRQELVARSEKAAASETAGEELARLQAALTESQRSAAAARQELEARSVEFAALERQIRELDNERSLLEAELETVRHRTVELAETAAAERARMAEEREHWSRELKQLRKNSELLQTAPAVAVAPVAAVSATQLAGVSPAAATIDGDPMLESVMAQFDMLRKDIARRRVNGKTPTR